MANTSDKKALVKVDREIHKELKVRAAKEGKKLEQVIEETLKKGLKDNN